MISHFFAMGFASQSYIHATLPLYPLISGGCCIHVLLAFRQKKYDWRVILEFQDEADSLYSVT